MQVEFSVTLLWSLANNLSFWAAALLTNSTLTRRRNAGQTFLGWVLFAALHLVTCVASYSINITDDNINFLSMLVLMPAAAVVLYADERAARVFTSVMGALIANVTTFFFCGTTLSFIDNTPNPYNMRTVGIFLCIKAFWFTVMFFAYRRFVSKIVQQVISVLGKQLKKLGMLIVQDQVWNRVTINRSASKSTRYYIDEFHLLLKEEQTAAYSVEIWKRFRKWGGIPTGITQNVKDLLASREIENIFENSDFILMLNQASGDRQILAKQLNISPHQLSYVTNSGEGEGLVFYGSTIIPFKDKFDNSLMLYALMTSKPDEVEKRKRLGIGERDEE